jgi:hypothetical protein
MASETPESKTNRNLPKRVGMLQRVKYVAINAFLIFHLIAIPCWCIPNTSPLIPICKNLVRPYFVWSGLFQSWDMFAPNPKSANSYMEAIILYKDRSSQLWSFPRMENLSLTQRYIKERYRKYEDNLQNNDNSELWPDAARRVARLNSDAANPAQSVLLVVRWSDIIPRTDGSYDRGPWDVNVFYSYPVKPEDLK